MTINKERHRLGMGLFMANGSLAVLMFAMGLWDMGGNYCGTEQGCLGKRDLPPRLAISAGRWIERRADVQEELYLRYDFGFAHGPFGNAIGVSYAENGESWIGYGQTYRIGERYYAELHAMPGLYFENDGFDLGGRIQFRSGIEIGYSFENGNAIGISYDHRSNAGLYADNPGVETIQLRFSYQF